MYCSNRCKSKVHQSYDAQKERSLERKLAFVEALGGKCNRCGYKDNLAALSFHHTSGKEYKLDARSMSNRGINTIRKEITKCELLCANCHMQLHNPTLNLAKLSIEPPALTTELQAPIHHEDKRIIAKNPPLEKEFAANLEKIDLKDGHTIVLGISGGVDSIVMLDLFAKSELKLNLVVAHFNHGVRTDSDTDEKFVKALAKKYGFPFVSKKLGSGIHSNILANVVMSSNQEEYLRDERRHFLLSVLKTHGADYLTLAHNADDQAETFIMNALRGSGPAGLGAMNLNEDQIIRPLLDISRQEIESYATKNKLRWHEDSTNTDTRYTRNYIRHQILPLLARINPDFLSGIGRTTYLQQEIENYLVTKSAWLISQLKENIAIASAIPKPLLYEALATMYEEVRGNRKNLSLAHLDSIIELTTETCGSKSVDLPDRIIAVRNYNHLDFVRKIEDNKTPETSEKPLRLGLNMWPGFDVQVTENTETTSVAGPSCIVVEEIRGIRIRGPRAGDRIPPLGLSGHKKLQDLFVNAKIDKASRTNWPVITDGDEKIIWVPGLAVAESQRNKKGKYTIKIEKSNS